MYKPAHRSRQADPTIRPKKPGSSQGSDPLTDGGPGRSRIIVPRFLQNTVITWAFRLGIGATALQGGNALAEEAQPPRAEEVEREPITIEGTVTTLLNRETSEGDVYVVSTRGTYTLTITANEAGTVLLDIYPGLNNGACAPDAAPSNVTIAYTITHPANPETGEVETEEVEFVRQALCSSTRSSPTLPGMGVGILIREDDDLPPEGLPQIGISVVEGDRISVTSPGGLVAVSFRPPTVESTPDGPVVEGPPDHEGEGDQGQEGQGDGQPAQGRGADPRPRIRRTRPPLFLLESQGTFLTRFGRDVVGGDSTYVNAFGVIWFNQARTVGLGLGALSNIDGMGLDNDQGVVSLRSVSANGVAGLAFNTGNHFILLYGFGGYQGTFIDLQSGQEETAQNFEYDEHQGIGGGGLRYHIGDLFTFDARVSSNPFSRLTARVFGSLPGDLGPSGWGNNVSPSLEVVLRWTGNPTFRTVEGTDVVAPDVSVNTVLLHAMAGLPIWDFGPFTPVGLLGVLANLGETGYGAEFLMGTRFVIHTDNFDLLFDGGVSIPEWSPFFNANIVIPVGRTDPNPAPTE